MKSLHFKTMSVLNDLNLKINIIEYLSVGNFLSRPIYSANYNIPKLVISMNEETFANRMLHIVMRRVLSN